MTAHRGRFFKVPIFFCNTSVTVGSTPIVLNWVSSYHDGDRVHMQSVVNFQVKLKTDKVGLDLHTARQTETLHGELKHNNMGPFTNHVVVVLMECTK